MILAFWCVLVAALLPPVCSYVAKYGRGRTEDGGPAPRFDNRHPRAWLAAQTGLRARADAAQQNGFEVLPLFIAAVVVAVLQHVPVATIDLLAATFIVARVAYIACYLLDRPALRSLTYAIGFACCLGLFLVAAGGTLW